MISDSETSSSQSSQTNFNRLGLCEVCDEKQAQYTCPKCEVKTCCLNCLTIHKKELDCNGIRDKTKFIPIKSMTEMDFMSDYTFLEECTRYVSNRKSDKLKMYTRFNKSLPSPLYKLRMAALERKITLRFLLRLFTRHKENTTFYDQKMKKIYWHIEWIFPMANNLKFSDERIDENTLLSDLLNKYLAPNEHIVTAVPKPLEYYQSRGVAGVRIFLKAEGIKRCKNRYYELSADKTLNENLCGKTIVEFPTIFIVYKDIVADNFDVIDSDEDIAQETLLYNTKLNNKYGNKTEHLANKINDQDGMACGMKQMEIDDKASQRKCKKRTANNLQKNLLFTDESALNNLSSDSDDNGDETEEEDGNICEPPLAKNAKI